MNFGQNGSCDQKMLILQSLYNFISTLDTTYCKAEYDFPNQSSVINCSVDLMKKHLQKYPKTLICVGSYTIGKERIFLAIANEIDAKIWGSTEKCRVLKTLSDPIIESRLINDPNKAQVHVVEMIKVKRKDLLQEHLNKFSNYQTILGIGMVFNKTSIVTIFNHKHIKDFKPKIYQLI